MPLYLNDISENAQTYKITNFACLYKKGPELFKVFRDYEYADLEMIEYLTTLNGHVLENNIIPKELIFYGDTICGYKQDFINSYTFESALRKKISIEEKALIINSLSDALQDINQFIIVNDINLSNLLIPKNKSDQKGYMIDFDLAKKINESSCCCLSCYKIKTLNAGSLEENLNTDKIKMFISFLSLLYGFNFEEMVGSYKCKSTLDAILEKLECLKNNGMLMEYANYLKNQFDKNLPIDEYFFIPENYNLEKEIEVGRRLIRKKKNKL